MNIIIGILLLFSLAGLLDQLAGGRLGLAPDFRKGLSSMGSLCLAMSGFYCGALWLAENSSGLLQSLHDLPLDPSLLPASLLAPDMGGFPLSQSLASTQKLGLFSGVLVSSTLGCLVSFSLPISLGMLSREDRTHFMLGSAWGIALLPLGLIPGGLLLGLSLSELISGILPTALLCGVLLLALQVIPRFTVSAMNVLGNLIRDLGYFLFILLIFGLFFPEQALFSPALTGEAMLVVVKITAVVCGSMVLSHLVTTSCRKSLCSLSRRLHMAPESILGLILSLATSISMIPLYPSMDDRGKRINAAFAVGGAFCMGGQLAYLAAVSSRRAVGAYLVCKLTCGIFGAAGAYFSFKKQGISAR